MMSVCVKQSLYQTERYWGSNEKEKNLDKESDTVERKMSVRKFREGSAYREHILKYAMQDDVSVYLLFRSFAHFVYTS